MQMSAESPSMWSGNYRATDLEFLVNNKLTSSFSTFSSIRINNYFTQQLNGTKRLQLSYLILYANGLKISKAIGTSVPN